MPNFTSLKKKLRPSYVRIWKVWEKLTDTNSGNTPVVIQGIQRSGTNYLTQLLNRADYKVVNRIDPKRHDPTHKHFRWQKEKKTIVMDRRYHNNITADSVQEINKICNYPIDYKHIVIFREPENWINSIYRWGLSCGWYKNENEFFKRNLHELFLNEWDHYYSFWQNVSEKSNNFVLLVNHENVVKDPQKNINIIDNFLDISRDNNFNIDIKVEKVRHSRPIGDERNPLMDQRLDYSLNRTWKFNWNYFKEYQY